MTVHPRNGSGGPDSQNKINEEADLKEVTNNESEVEQKETTPEQHVAELEELVNNIKIEKPQNEADDFLVTKDDFDETGDPIFPHELLAKLDDMVNKPKWIIPVLPDAELEKLVDATIKLAKKGNKKFNLFYMFCYLDKVKAELF